MKMTNLALYVICDGHKMKYFNINEIWMRLSTDQVGFFTKDNDTKIPTIPGVYAWFFPIDLKLSDKDKIKYQLVKLRKIYSYDAKIHDLASLTNHYGFNWDPFSVTIKKLPEFLQVSENQFDFYDELLSLPANDQFNTRLYTLIGTLFTRPLYIGLTLNLKERYESHVNGYGKGNTFHKRFNDYIEKLGYDDQVRDLLFVCIPFLNYIKSNGQIDLDSQLRFVEALLKLLGQPIFGEK